MTAGHAVVAGASSATFDEGPDRPIVALVVATFAALLLIPERYTVPLSARFGLRPYQILLVAVAAIVTLQFRRGRPVTVGRPACVASVLVAVAAVSTVVNQDQLSEAAFLDACRLTVLMVFYTTLAVAVALVATSPRRRRNLLGVLVTLVAISALFAIRESTTAEPIRLDPTPPGLVEELNANEPVDETPSSVTRNGVVRPAGLAANPLELSAVMALGAPFAAYLVLSARSWLARSWFLACGLLIAVCLVLSISRTAVLTVATMLAIAFVANLRRPSQIVVGMVAVAAVGWIVTVLVPHSVDALIGQLGKDATEDPSLATRVQDYEELNLLLGPHPWLGRGPDAVSSYVARDASGLILDNQYLLAIADTGVVGLIVLLAVLTSAALAAARLARTATAERGLFLAALCAVAAFAVMCATFDVMRFAQATSIFMIVVGLASVADLAAPERTPDPEPPH